MTLDELFSANDWNDDEEPWGLADDCEAVIDFRGGDMVVLCEDGVARWTNSQREWTEVEGSHAAGIVEEIDDATEAAKFVGWLRRWWDVAEMAIEADAAEERVRQEIREAADMPREVLCDYLADIGHPDAGLIRRHTADIEG